jgi:hypothetical protein
LAAWVNLGVDWIVVNYGDFFESVANVVLVVLVQLELFRFNGKQGSRGEAREVYIEYMSMLRPKANAVYS